jgi:hypothetical protein
VLPTNCREGHPKAGVKIELSQLDELYPNQLYSSKTCDGTHKVSIITKAPTFGFHCAPKCTMITYSFVDVPLDAHHALVIACRRSTLLSLKSISRPQTAFFVRG